MDMNEFEFMGKDRYFKYRYAEETHLNVRTITESWGFEKRAKQYQTMAEYLKRAFNVKVLYEENKVSYFDLDKLYDPSFSKKAHINLIPTPLSLFEGRQEYFTPSSPYELSKTIIVSAAPKKMMSKTLSFVSMDSEVVILMLLSVLLVSLLLVIHSVVMNKYKSMPTKKVSKKLAIETMENVWENASLLYAEPIPAVLPHITSRLLVSSWLIGVTFILFFLGCFLRTEFTTESYEFIDTLSDLIKSGIPPIMIEGTATLEYLKYLGAQDPVVQEWLDTLDEENLFVSAGDYITLEGYLPILSGEKALIVTDTYLFWLMGELLDSDSESKEFFADNGGLYFSEKKVDFEYLHFIFNASWMRSSPQVHENQQLSVLPLFETQVFNYLDFEMHRLIEYVKWKRSLKSMTNLDLSSVSVPFYLLFMLMSGTVAVVITEMFFKILA